MSESATITAGVAGRYATALFELAVETDSLASVENDVNALSAALSESADLRELIESPIYGRDAQGRAMAAIGAALGLGSFTAGTLGVMASKRRLFALPAVLTLFRERLAAHRGEVTAEVTAARALTEAQQTALAEALKGKMGREVALDIRVDDSLIGGLIVKVGSKMIDTSIRSKLAALKTTMREAG
ncbi:MAG: F0F1 ATP synthase subunit delta [Pseudomonadota bacterium]